MAEMSGVRERDWLARGGRLRAGWRILVYFAVLAALLLVGQYAASLLPRHPLGWASWMVTAAASLMAGWAVLTHLDGRAPGALGFPWSRAALHDVLLGLGLGGGIQLAAAALLVATGAARLTGDAGSVDGYLAHLVVTLAFFTIAAAAEELLFRGYAFQALVEGIGAWPAVLVSSAVFSWMHGANPNIGVIAFANIFLAGVLLALAYLRTRSLWFATALHAGWNWTMATLLDFPVSGLTGFDTPLYDAVETGPAWWTGGAFGPEAGLAGTLVLALGVLIILRSRRLVERPEMRALRPLVDRRLGPAEP